MAKQKEERVAVEFEDDPYEGEGEEPQIEFITEAEAEREKAAGMLERDEAMERIRALEAQLEEQRKRGDEVDRLTEAVSGLQQPAPAPPRESTVIEKQPQETWEEYQERVNEKFLENPATNVRDMISRLVAPELQKVAQYAQAAVRNTVVGDPVYQKYSDEVEAFVSQAPDRLSNPNVYREAIERVTARHISDVVAEQVAAELAKQQAQNGGRKSERSPAPQFTESGTRPAPPSRTTVRRYVKTASDERERLAMGLSETDYYTYKYGR